MNAKRFLEKDGRGRNLIAVGRYAGEFLADVASEDPRYLRWVLREADDLGDEDRDEIEQALR